MDEPAPERDPFDLVVLLTTVPERLADLVLLLDEPRLRHRHAPALPTARELVTHVCDSGIAADHLLRQACLEGLRDLALRAILEPVREPDSERPLGDLLESFGRSRRRTVELLAGLEPEAWAREVSDPRQGRMAFADAVEQVVHHELGHLTQLRNLTAQLPEG